MVKKYLNDADCDLWISTTWKYMDFTTAGTVV